MGTTTRTSALLAGITSVAGAMLLGTTPASAATVTSVASAAAVPPITATVGTEYLAQNNAWSPVIATRPGERLRVLVTYANASSTEVERGVSIGVKLPKGVTLNGAVTLTNSLTAGKTLPGAGLIARGARIGDYGPQANSYLVFFVRMPKASSLRCGITPLTMRLTERAGRAMGAATLHWHVHHDCPTSMTSVPIPG